jgi:hypothetical protein
LIFEEHHIHKKMKNKKGMNFFEGLLLFILIAGTLFELTLLFIAWQYADRVKCNLLWCEFTKTRYKSEVVYQITDVDMKNNSEINCNIPSADFVGVIYNDTDVYCLQNHSQVTCYQKEYYIT